MRPRVPRVILVAALIAAGAGGACAGAASAPVPAASSSPARSPTLDVPIALETATGTIHGSLDLPGGEGPVPVALIIAGSGPTDRNGNILGAPGGNNAYRMLAEALAARGIATVRYDKRGIGASGAAAASEAELRFEHYVEDAEGWLRMLREDPRFSTVTVIGHSEGSLIGMLAAERAGADAFVSVAGVARRASDILRDQLSGNLPPELQERNERILQRLESGAMADSVPAELMTLYRPSVQPYVISWMRYLPADEIARLDVPVLILQGTTDVQVGVAEAEELSRRSPGARLEIIEGMNHVLKRVGGPPAEQQASYFDPSIPVVEELVEVMAEFVRGVGAGGAAR